MFVEFSISTNSAVSMNRRFYRAYANLDSKNILTRLQYFKNHNGRATDEIDDDKSVLLSHIFFLLQCTPFLAVPFESIFPWLSHSDELMESAG